MSKQTNLTRICKFDVLQRSGTDWSAFWTRIFTASSEGHLSLMNFLGEMEDAKHAAADDAAKKAAAASTETSEPDNEAKVKSEMATDSEDKNTNRVAGVGGPHSSLMSVKEIVCLFDEEAVEKSNSLHKSESANKVGSEINMVLLKSFCAVVEAHLWQAYYKSILTEGSARLVYTIADPKVPPVLLGESDRDHPLVVPFAGEVSMVRAGKQSSIELGTLFNVPVWLNAAGSSTAMADVPVPAWALKHAAPEKASFKMSERELVVHWVSDGWTTTAMPDESKLSVTLQIPSLEEQFDDNGKSKLSELPKQSISSSKELVRMPTRPCLPVEQMPTVPPMGAHHRKLEEEDIEEPANKKTKTAKFDEIPVKHLLN